MAINYDYPKDMIVPFDTACPSGWTRYTALDSKFPRAAATSGTTGGSDASHRHLVNPSLVNTTMFEISTTILATASLQRRYSSQTNHTHSINLPSTNTSYTQSLPPYINVVFCKKD
jgi:hypothetical protein